MVIAVSGHHTKRGWANAPCNGSRNSLPLGVDLNQEKTRMVDMPKGEAFGKRSAPKWSQRSGQIS